MDGQPTSFPRERRVYGKLCTESLIYAEGRPGYSYLTGEILFWVDWPMNNYAVTLTSGP